MPRKKKVNIKKFKKPKFIPEPVVDVITLSDSEDSKDHIEIIESSADIIDVSESSSSSSSDDENEVEVVTIDDDSLLCDKNCKGFCPHMEAPDYIPIPVFNGCRSISNTRNRKRRRKGQFVEKHQQNGKCEQIIQLEKPNVFDASTEEQKQCGLRPVIIDGSNVAFGFGNGEFKIQGVIAVIQFFLRRGHEDIVCFLPAHYKHKCRTPSENKILSVYEKDRLIVYTPSRNLNGIYITPYDDRYIIQYAHEKNGVVISNDGFRDLLKEDKTWTDTIVNRILNYTFAKDLLMLPKDPLGRGGITLDEMLRFP